MKILKPKQMAQWDRMTLKKKGISGGILMKRAAQACLKELRKRSSGLKDLRCVILCGPGNNGGDGFALAGLLEPISSEVQCFYWGQAKTYSPEANDFFSHLKKPPIYLASTDSKRKLQQELKKAHWVVDALFGTGLSRKVTGPCAYMIQAANQSSAKKMAIDMPSGLSGDSGEGLGPVFTAEVTVTFEVPKWGQLQSSAWDDVGDLAVYSIGLVRQALKKFPAAGEWLTADAVKAFFAPRPKNMHKGKAGTALILAGSPQMPGAGALCGLGALRSGAGRVILGLPQGVKEKVSLNIPELILEFLSSDPSGLNSEAEVSVKNLRQKAQAMALGPGWGTGAGTQRFLIWLLGQRRMPLVLDADALNILSLNRHLLKRIQGAILTPHPKEMARILHCSVSTLMKNRVALVKKFSKKFGVYLILKSFRSIAVNPQGKVWINSVGGPNLAVAGSGDVLTGIIVGLLAQGLRPQAAMLAGLYLHGRAGDRLATRQGDRGTLASEIAKEVPRVIQELI